MIPVTGNFIHGREYDVLVRLATNTQWGDWSHVVPFSLALVPPSVPSSAELTVTLVTLADGTIVFHLTWPSFARKLSTVPG